MGDLLFRESGYTRRKRMGRKLRSESVLGFIRLSPYHRLRLAPSKEDDVKRTPGSDLSRRNFLKIGGAALAAGAIVPSGKAEMSISEGTEPGIRRYRTLGRTGFKVSDISLGCAPVSDANVIRYAYDHGLNYFDTAETYGGGASERAIGEAMQFLDRDKIFISTKLLVNEDDTETTLRDRFTACLERMNTDRADALFNHDTQSMDLVTHEGFHAAVASLKAEGRLKHAGISSHGPRGRGQDGLGDVLVNAAEDNRYDLMLLTYNFLNESEADRVLVACKARNIGTTAMKTVPGYINVEPWDEDAPFQPYLDYIERAGQNGVSREQAIENIKNWIASQMSVTEQMKPFVAKHGIESDERMHEASVQWVLKNPDMHTVCVSMPDFDTMGRFLPLSGTQLSDAGATLLDDFRLAVGDRYCRHGCSDCNSVCPSDVPVSTIMRYSYYFAMQGREKYAMGKYAKLGDRNVLQCMGCSAPCLDACSHGVQVQANLLAADTRLRLV